MRKLKLIILLCVLSPVFLCAQYNFRINGSIDKDFENLKLSLALKDDIGRYTEQEIVGRVHDGHANFSGMILQPSKNALLEVNKNGKKFSGQFVLDTGENILNISIIDTLNGLLNIEVKNSVSNLIKFKMDSVARDVTNEYKANNKPVGAWALPIQETRQLDIYYLKIISSFPDSYYSLMRLYFLSKHASMLNYKELIINAYYKFNNDLKVSDLGQRIFEDYERSASAYHASRIGQKILDFTINTSEGSSFSNKSLTGKPYILAFGATWCVPCQEQLPMLKDLYQKYKSQGLEVVYYNTDNDFAKWTAHVKKNKLNWINISEKKDPDQLSRRLFINYIPTYLIIDKDGIIRYNSDQIDPEREHLEDHVKKVL